MYRFEGPNMMPVSLMQPIYASSEYDVITELAPPAKEVKQVDDESRRQFVVIQSRSSFWFSFIQTPNMNSTRGRKMVCGQPIRTGCNHWDQNFYTLNLKLKSPIIFVCLY